MSLRKRRKLEVKFVPVGIRGRTVLKPDWSQSAGDTGTATEDGVDATTLCSAGACKDSPCVPSANANGLRPVCCGHWSERYHKTAGDASLVPGSPAAVVLPPAEGGSAAEGGRSSDPGNAPDGKPASYGRLPGSTEAMVTPAAAAQPRKDAAGQLLRDSGATAGTAAGRSAFTGFATGRGGNITVSKAATDRMSKLFATEADLFADRPVPHGAAEAPLPPSAHHHSLRTPVQQTRATEHAQIPEDAEQQAGNSKDTVKNSKQSSIRKGELLANSSRTSA